MLGSAAYQDADELKLSRTERNFIIDGDFTQWPDGTSARTLTGGRVYYPALWTGQNATTGSVTIERSTDVPTVAASNHQSSYSMLVKCTGTDTVASGEYLQLEHKITGSDFASLHQQDFVISFWAKTAANNSGHNYNLTLGASSDVRMRVETFAPTSTWTQFTFAVTGDTGGTWLLTEADVGLRVGIALDAGTAYDDATEGSWTGGYDLWSSTGTAISPFMASTSNEFYLSQVSLTLGSTAPTFTSPSIAIVQSQVDYYVESISGYIGSGWANTSNAGLGVCHWTTKRRAPTVTYIDQTSFYIETSASGGNATTMGMYLAKERSGRWSWARSGASHTTGHGAVVRADGTGRLLVDARH
jgi:hypothetical protein